jgi:hypothetical protein
MALYLNQPISLPQDEALAIFPEGNIPKPTGF